MVADDRFGFLQPVVDADLGGSASCHEAGARRGADGAGGEGVGEAGPLGCEAVQIGRAQFAVAVASIGPLAVVVGQEEKDIGAGHLDVPV